MNIADAGEAIGMIAEYGECRAAADRIETITNAEEREPSGRSVKVAINGRDFSFCARRDRHALNALVLTLRRRMSEISMRLSAIGVDTTPRAPAAKETA